MLVRKRHNMPSIMLVDKEPAHLNRLVQQLAQVFPDWSVYALSSASEAAELLTAKKFDAVISELYLPEKVGDHLLDLAANTNPKSLRVLLCEDIRQGSYFTSIGVCHQFLPKPVQVTELSSAILRAISLRNIFEKPAITDLISKTSCFPALPDTYLKIIKLLRKEDYLQSELLEVLHQDITVTAELLKLANSALLGYRRKITNLSQAITILGTNTIKVAVLAINTFSRVENKKFSKFNISALWKHSFEVASLAASLASKDKNCRHLRDDVLTAGVLHDIGKLILIENFPEQYEEVKRLEYETFVFSNDAEMQIFGTSHQEIGAYVLGLWGLPDQILEAVAFHHLPNNCTYRQKSVLSFIASANMLSKDLSPLQNGTQINDLCTYLDDIHADIEKEKLLAHLGR